MNVEAPQPVAPAEAADVPRVCSGPDLTRCADLSPARKEIPSGVGRQWKALAVGKGALVDRRA